MKNWFNNLTGRLGRKIDNKGSKALKEYDAEASKYLGLGRFSSKAKDKKKKLTKLEALKAKSKSNRRAGAGVILGTAGIGGGTYAYHKTKGKAKTQKLKASLVDKADAIYQKGQSDYENRMLQDPNFPLPVKLKLLESKGVIKQASLKKILTLENVSEAKSIRNELGKKVSNLSEAKAPEKVISKASKEHDEAIKKLRNERLKSSGTYATGVTVLGGAHYGARKYHMNKKASKYTLPLAGAGAGALLGPAVTYLHPDIDSTKSNLLQSAALGSIVGTGMGAGINYARKAGGGGGSVEKRAPQLPNNTQPMEDIPVT